MSDCAPRHFPYFYNASAYGLAGEMERPLRHSIPMQAATALANSGGRGFQRVENFSAPPYISFDAAYTEVGGSFDECHNKHTTFAYSVIEGLNIAGMITADRIVARMAIYSPQVNSQENGSARSNNQPARKRGRRTPNSQSSQPADEHAFDITGSYFLNLRIGGYPINVELAARHLQQYECYSTLEEAITKPGSGEGAGSANSAASYDLRKLQPWGHLNNKQLDTLKKLEKDYHALTGIGDRAQKWKTNPGTHRGSGVYWLSAAGHYELDPNSGLTGFGGIICIPKFGVVRLAEILVHRHHRYLQMLRVDMCSTSSGSATASGGGGGGTTGSGPG
jgi:hypothetical protein